MQKEGLAGSSPEIAHFLTHLPFEAQMVAPCRARTKLADDSESLPHPFLQRSVVRCRLGAGLHKLKK